jgi:hypothetical protein
MRPFIPDPPPLAIRVKPLLLEPSTLLALNEFEPSFAEDEEI